ncbi:MAG: amidase [Chloroflexi bacterium]|nr:amidase [Chloroflexota bacterium]
MTAAPLFQPISLASDVQALRQADRSPSALIDDLEARFEAIEPVISAYLPVPARFDRLRRDAKLLEQRYPNAETRPPLYGALLGVKDIFHVEGFTTRAGTQVPPEAFAGDEADIVTRLKRAGALIVGKTVTTEFAYFEPGPTRNPQNPDHSPGGSSSGSAAAIASGLAHVTVGTQTVGSVIRPAAYCGVFGYKPSFGRVDTSGLVVFSPSADHVGFFTADAASMQTAASAVIDDWQPTLDRPARPALALPVGRYLEQSSALAAFESQVKQLTQAGYAIQRIPMFDDIEAINECHQDLIAAELACQHRQRFAQYKRLYRPRTAALIHRGQAVSDQRLRVARESRLKFRQRLHRVMDEEGIDLWICPSAPDVAPRGIETTGSPLMNLPWTHAGAPVVSLPAGRGMLSLPLGLQLVGRFGEDEPLLAWAHAIEPLFAA